MTEFGLPLVSGLVATPASGSPRTFRPASSRQQPDARRSRLLEDRIAMAVADGDGVAPSWNTGSAVRLTHVATRASVVVLVELDRPAKSNGVAGGGEVVVKFALPSAPYHRLFVNHAGTSGESATVLQERRSPPDSHRTFISGGQ